jgi:hypothetical protein
MHYFSPWNGERFPKGNRRWNFGVRVVGRTRNVSPSSQVHAVSAMGKSGLTKTQADDLLDWLEANGYEHYEISAVNEQSFSVRWWD